MEQDRHGSKVWVAGFGNEYQDLLTLAYPEQKGRRNVPGLLEEEYGKLI